MFYPEERFALFIDGANIFSATRELGFDIDYRRLLGYFQIKGRLVRAFYYTAILEDRETGHQSIRPLVDWLDFNGYTTVTKEAKRYDGPDGRSRVKGNMDIELVIDMLEMAPHIEHAVLMSGDGDFRRLVEVMQRRGVRVTVISTMKTKPSMISEDLRRQADEFVDLTEIRPSVERASREDREDREEDDDC